MSQEKPLDALGLDALTGFSEETWAEFLLGLAQHSGDINRFFGRHEEAHWGTLTIGQVKEWYEWRRRQQHALGAPQPSSYQEWGMSPGGIPAGQPNAHYYDDEEEELDLYEREMVAWIQARHPEWTPAYDGNEVYVDEIPREYWLEWIKFRNPNAILEIGGFPIEELTEILDRHRDELQKIPGYAGSGIDKDGIAITVMEPHGEFPTELEGAKTHLLPAVTAVLLGR